jgi:hypothetical protein
VFASQDFQNLISRIPMVDHSPQDVTSDTEQQYSERSDDDESDDDDDDDDESSEEGDEAESSLSYEAPKEPRFKALHDTKGKAGETQQLSHN